MVARRCLAMLAALCLSMAAARAQPQEAEHVIRALIVQQPLPERACVEPRLTGPALSGIRGRMEPDWQRDIADPTMRARFLSAFASWQPPGTENAVERVAPVAIEGGQEIAEAVLRLLEAPPREWLDRIASDWLPAGTPLRSSPLRGCAIVTYSSPEIMGDVAFVETGLTCGALCGAGHLVALRRVAGAWRIVGLMPTWVS